MMMFTAASMQNTRRSSSDAKTENDALRDDVAAGRRQFAHQSSLVSRKLVKPPPPAWIYSLPRLADTAEQSYFTLEGADHYAKTTEGTRSILARAVQSELPISMGNSCLM